MGRRPVKWLLRFVTCRSHEPRYRILGGRGSMPASGPSHPGGATASRYIGSRDLACADPIRLRDHHGAIWFCRVLNMSMSLAPTTFSARPTRERGRGSEIALLKTKSTIPNSARLTERR